MSLDLTMFDEYPNNTDEARHERRMALEPRIYKLLNDKYYSILDDYYKSAVIPLSKNAIVIIERRKHENFAFILRNAVYFARGWSIFVVCSDENLEFCRASATASAVASATASAKANITFMPIFKGSPDRDTARNEYNSLLKTAAFYESFPKCVKGIFIVEMDCYFLRNIPDYITRYDYVAAPYSWDKTSAGGGLSFRRIAAAIDICNRFPPDSIWAQDCYICNGMKTLGYNMPDFDTAYACIVESCLYEDPVGVHQWWTFFTNYVDNKELLFNGLTTLKID